MPFNLQTFKTRALTAVVFVAVMLAGLLWSHWSFFILFSVIHVGCWIEYQKLAGMIEPEYETINPTHKYGIITAGWAFMLFMAGNGYVIGNFPLHNIGRILLLITGIVLPLFLIILKRDFSAKTIIVSVVGLLYISISWALMINIRSMGLITRGGVVFYDNGLVISIVLISSIWINDTMAYVVGSFIGKTPFSKISPKKTWEGTIGGAILCIAVVSIAGMNVYPRLGLAPYIVISAIAAVFGTAGDLIESKFKRMAGVKDSGQIMPGHGGFLDRFDSLLLATPFVWLYLLIAKL